MSRRGALYAAAYDFLAAREDRRGAAELRRLVVQHAEGVVLEVGTGTGRCLPLYERAHRVIAIEPDADMRTRAIRRAAGARVPVEVRDGDASALNLPDGTVDEVVSCWVLCTVPDPRRALDEMRRVLRPGGLLRFCEHVRSADQNLAARQDRLAPLWRIIGRGCRCNQNTLDIIREQGFVEIDARSIDPTFTSPRIVRPTVVGTARKA